MQALPTCRVSALPWPSQLVAGPGGGRCSRRNQHQPGTALSSPCLQQRVGRATTTTARSALSPPQAFAADVALHGVLLPVVAGWLLVTSLRTIAGRARQWCEANPDEPLSMELLGLLPAALEQPTRLAVLLFVTTRVLRNLVAGTHGFIDAFKPQWSPETDALARALISNLGAFDAWLLKLYTVIAAVAAARVLIKWKSIGLEWWLHQRQQVDASEQVSGSSAAASSGAGATGSRAAGAAGQLEDDDFDEAGVVAREGSMLSVTMRPRSTGAATGLVTSSDRGLALASLADADGGAAGATSVGGWAGSSGSGSKQAVVQQQWQDGTGRLREEGAVERLVLPLDSILSWAISVSAALFTLQTLGISIAPLLAIGGASSLIIGLATQTLLTNAVMGLSIFLSRPFVPGDSITVQAAGAILVSGVVEKVTPMRTVLRTDDDVFVTLPNKTISEMICYNKSRREPRSRLVARSWERPHLKFKVKLPQKELEHLAQLQRDLRAVLRRPGVAQGSMEVVLAKFTDAGAEVLLTCLLLVGSSSPAAQELLLDLAVCVRKHQGTLVSIL